MVSTEGDLVVAFDVTNDRSSPVTTRADLVRYLPVDGPALAPPEDFQRDRTEIPPGVRLHTLVAFEEAGLGGTLVFAGTADGAVIEVEVPVPRPT